MQIIQQVLETLRAGSSKGMEDQFSHFVCKETEPREGKVTFSRHMAKQSQHLDSNLTLTSGSMLSIKKIQTA